jgi:hypothetical protein
MPREDGARDARHGARGRRAGGGSPKRDVKPPQPDIRGKRYTYGVRVGRGVPHQNPRDEWARDGATRRMRRSRDAGDRPHAS